MQRNNNQQQFSGFQPYYQVPAPYPPAPQQPQPCYPQQPRPPPYPPPPGQQRAPQMGGWSGCGNQGPPLPQPQQFQHQHQQQFQQYPPPQNIQQYGMQGQQQQQYGYTYTAPQPPRPHMQHNSPQQWMQQTPSFMQQPTLQPQNPVQNQQWRPKNATPPYFQGKRPYAQQSQSAKQAKKQRREKEILSQGHKITGPVKVREPVNEEERRELDQWIKDRKKFWPTKENIERKSRDNVMKSQEINNEEPSEKLAKILQIQKEMGLVSKAGTEDLVLSVLQDDSFVSRRGRGGRFRGRGRGHGRFGNNRGQRFRTQRGGHNNYNSNNKGNTGHRIEATNKGALQGKVSLYQKLVEDDIRKDRRLLLQALHFFTRNNFLTSVDSSQLVYPQEQVEQDQLQKEQIRKYMEQQDLESGDEDNEEQNSPKQTIHDMGGCTMVNGQQYDHNEEQARTQKNGVNNELTELRSSEDDDDDESNDDDSEDDGDDDNNDQQNDEDDNQDVAYDEKEEENDG
eukprot:TRINITY_DN9807_c0_g1_i1.p1 TRINITY_DN9807_c0_g1~~TRINITY_DN9807_c0_g1_i1.p1  ORF type:complete len:509 (-),score=72.60 TRINITY_DN9807_c0_g1_i1:276-1802(-)